PLQPVLRLRDRRRREGVRGDDVGARLEVVAMDALDVVGTGQAEGVDVAAKVVRMTVEALAADVVLAEPECLHLRAHGPVEEEDALLQDLLELFPRRQGALLLRRLSGRACASRRSRRPTGSLGVFVLVAKPPQCW